MHFFGVSCQAVLLLSASRLKHSKVVLDIIELYEVPGGNLVDGLPPAPSSFLENVFFSHTVSYDVSAGKIFRPLGAILLSKVLLEPTLHRHQKIHFPSHLVKLSAARCFKLQAI